MYLGVIVLTMVLLPLASIGIEYALAPASGINFLIGKWFVFWAVGVRLMLAGPHQIFRPAFTSATIFKIRDPDAGRIVMELGFGNVSIALLGLLSAYRADWITPAANTGAVFHGLAGLQHIRNGGRTHIESIAMISDLLIAAVLVMNPAAP